MVDREPRAHLQPRIHRVVCERRRRHVLARAIADRATRRGGTRRAHLRIRALSRRTFRARAVAHDRMAAIESVGASSLPLDACLAVPAGSCWRVSDAMSYGQLFHLL